MTHSKIFLFRILVSAPHGQAIDFANNRIVQLERRGNLLATGVIYTCPVTEGSCTGLTGNGRNEDRRLYDFDTNALPEGQSVSDGNQGEEKRGQFLGATLKSTGDTFLVGKYCYIRRYVLSVDYILFDL